MHYNALLVVLFLRVVVYGPQNLVSFNPILPGGGAKYAPLLFFLHHPETSQVIKLKLSDFKDKPLGHFLQVKPVRYILIEATKLQKVPHRILLQRKVKNQPIVKIFELKFGIETKFVPLSSKTNINLQFDVIMTF